MCFGLGFRQLDYFDAFILMGSIIIVSSVLSALILIKGQSSLWRGNTEEMTAEKANQANQTLSVPEHKDDILEEVDA